MADNTILKDGNGNSFYLRAKDVTPAQDGTTRRSMTFSTLYPVDYGFGGQYQKLSSTSAMAAGIAAAAPVHSFQWPSTTLLALIRRVRITAFSTGVAFTANALMHFDLFVARAFSVQLTGGTQATLTGNSAKLRTSMAASSANIMHASASALSGGVFTLDPSPANSCYGQAPAAANALSFNSVALFQAAPGEPPLVLAQNEGFIIQATVPATGTWGFAVVSEWDEVPPFYAGY